MPSTISRRYAMLACAIAGTTAFAQPLPLARSPEEFGFSSLRLQATRSAIEANVKENKAPGAVLMIARKGKIVTYDAIGFQDRGSKTPMKKDSIFRIASMSKPIATVAAMMLAEENKLDLGAPVAQYLPEFKSVKVGIEGVAPKRPMTVQDLMRHTSGLTYGLFGNSPVDQLYRKANIFGADSLASMVKTIATMPLLHQPGEAWEYSVSTDVLGRVVEVASGMDLASFIEMRITGPLKMVDTGFWVKQSGLPRIAQADTPNPVDPGKKPAIFSGGGGMFSTAGDYARFSQMLLNGGILDGLRILSPKSVAMMTSDQIPPSATRQTPVALSLGAFGPTPEMGLSFGLGFSVRVDPGRSPLPGSVGDYSWCGITGPLFWVDPKEKLVVVMMVQSGPERNVLWRQTRTTVYQAMTD